MKSHVVSASASPTVSTDSQTAPADRSGYKGDSLGKKLARVYLWARIVEHLRAIGAGDETVAYLASREGGDAGTLKALGWPAAQQLAIDRDAGALALFAKRHPDVPTALGDIGAVVAAAPARFAAIYLDFCSPGTNAALDLIARCAARVRPGGRMAYCALRGRERGAKSAAIVSSAADTRAFSLDVTQQVFGLDEATLEATLAELPQAFQNAKKRAHDGRSDLFQSYVQRRLAPQRIAPRYVTYLAYQSETLTSRGVPMMIDDWVVEYYGRGIALERFNRLRAEAAWRGAKQRVEQTLLARVRLGKNMVARLPLRDVAELPGCSVDLVEAGTGDLVEVSYELDAMGVDPASALNVEPGSLAAWRAHHTRGSYASEGVVIL